MATCVASGRTTSPRLRGLMLAVVTVVATLAIATISLELWDADFNVPFRYKEDTLHYGAFIKGVLDHGWFQQNPQLGAPFGLKLYDFPQSGDNLNYLLIKILAFPSGQWPFAMNLFFIATFVLTSLAALFALRQMGISRSVSFVFALLFSSLPYHFIRGENHLFLSAYYGIPLAVLLCVWAVPKDGDSLQPRSLNRKALTILFCVIIGSAGIYYAVFSIILLAAVTVVVLAPRRSFRGLLPAGLPAVLILVVLAVNLSPSIHYALTHGRNDSFDRQRWEPEIYGLKITEMLLPFDGHRIKAFSTLRERYRKYPTSTREEHPVGATAGIGFIVLLFVAFKRMFAGPRAGGDLLGLFALLTMTSVLVGTVGGFSSLMSLAITSQIRSWNRISIFIAFLGLAAIALLLDRFRRSGLAGLAIVGIVGLLDQTSQSLVPKYDLVAREFRADQDFVRRIENDRRGVSVFQLPYRRFPEGGEGKGIEDYDPLRPYLHSRTSFWSFGSIKGRSEARWLRDTSVQPLVASLPKLSAVGFDGVMVDRTGYADRGRSLEAELRRILDPDVVESHDGRFLFLDMSGYNQQLQASIGSTRLRALRTSVFNEARARDE